MSKFLQARERSLKRLQNDEEEDEVVNEIGIAIYLNDF